MLRAGRPLLRLRADGHGYFRARRGLLPPGAYEVAASPVRRAVTVVPDRATLVELFLPD